MFANYLGTMVFAALIIVFAILIAVLINQPIKGKGIFDFLPNGDFDRTGLGQLILQDATSLPSISNLLTLIIMNNLPAFGGAS